MSDKAESSSSRRHVAIDLGASGGRIAIGTAVAGRLDVEVVHRFPNHSVPLRGSIYWDVLALWREILHGLSLAAKHLPIESVGVDSWAVDYALVDDRGLLLDGVHHYRSPRNDGAMERVIARLGREAIYEHTGLQFLPFNTAYQFEAHLGSEDIYQAAERLLMVPDLFHFWLSGKWSNERTNASSTQMYDPRTGDWSEFMQRAVGASPHLFEPISDPGTVLGELTKEVAEATGLHGTKVVLPATHDTASAVAAVPAEGNEWAYISSGTWSLVGIESPAPVITPDALRTELTNEAGINGTTRLLKNLMGLWILQECRRAWGDVPYEELYAEAEAIEDGPTFNVDDPSFLHPGTDMPERVRSICAVESRGALVRAVFDSLALRTAEILSMLERVSGRTIRTVHIVGGGSQIELLNRLIARASGRPVIAGPVEATLIGNLLVQAEACGSIPSGSLRDVVRAGSTLKRYEP